MTKFIFRIQRNKKFDIYLQYFKKEVCEEVDFLYTDKNESFLQLDTMIFDDDGQTFPRFPKQQVSNVFRITYKRSWR